MRDLFPGHYRPTPEQFEELWATATFVFDTNVLLDFYRYSPETRDQLFNILKILGDRVWIPYQVAVEFHRNRLEVIGEQEEYYKKFLELLASIEEKLGQFRTKLHPQQEHLGKIIEQIVKTTRRAAKGVDRLESQHPSLSQADSIGERIAELFQGRVGEKLTSDALQTIYKEGTQRYSDKIPPGYIDAKNKQEPGMYGDLVIWKEMMELGRTSLKPIIFVTRDAKEDWFQRLRGKAIGPRPELGDEMMREVSVQFYAYSTPMFMQQAAEKLLSTANSQEVANAIEEMNEIENAYVYGRVGYSTPLSELYSKMGPGPYSVDIELPKPTSVGTDAAMKALQNSDEIYRAALSTLLNPIQWPEPELQLSEEIKNSIVGKAITNFQNLSDYIEPAAMQFFRSYEAARKDLENYVSPLITPEIAAVALDNVLTAIPLSAKGSTENSRFITNDQYGDKWPFLVSGGLLRCEFGSAVTLTVGDMTYALNGTAQMKRLGVSVESIRREDSQKPGSKMDIGPIIKLGLSLGNK